jgi:hypothetical protein
MTKEGNKCSYAILIISNLPEFLFCVSNTIHLFLNEYISTK